MAKCAGCSCVTVSRGRDTRPPSSFAVQRAGRDHGLPGGQHLGAAAGVQGEPDAVVRHGDVQHGDPVPDVGPAARGETLHHRQGGVGIQLPAVGHVQHLLVEPDAAPAFGGFGSRQELGPQAGAVQGVPDVAQPRIGPVVHDAGARQEALAAVSFELVPQADRFGQHRHVVRIGVAGVEVPCGAVGSAVAVPRG